MKQVLENLGVKELKKSLVQQAIANLSSADLKLLEALNEINSINLNKFVKANYSSVRGVEMPDGEFVMAINKTKPLVAQWGMQSRDHIMGTLNESIASKITAGLNKKAGVQEIARSIRTLLIGDKNSYAHARTIARTETARLFNTGKFAAYEQIETNGHGKMMKYWIPGASGDERDWHTELGNMDPVELDFEYELVAPDGTVEYAKFPHDGSLSAVNIINCRCTIGEIFEAGV